MRPKYFKNRSWDEITREERVFCAELFFHIRKDPEDFVNLLKEEANFPHGISGPWDVAYEACFYRDFRFKFGSPKNSKYSLKRTFDIALFGDNAIIIIEAKAAQQFTTKQKEYFEKDLGKIVSLIGSEIKIYFVALGSQRYFENYKRYGRHKPNDPDSVLEHFKNRHLTWEAVKKHYPDIPLFKRACEVYKEKPVPRYSQIKTPRGGDCTT